MSVGNVSEFMAIGDPNPLDFEGIGYLPGAASSYAYGVSAHGSTVVGGSGADAFRWTASTGLVDLGAGSASATNADGSVVAGGGFLWTQAMGTVSFAGGTNGISADGTVLAGLSYPGHLNQAFGWAAATGFFGIPTLPGYDGTSSAWGISADGTAIVGYQSTIGASAEQAFLWTARNDIHRL
jgi:uncharacterized membrane protein